MHTRLLQLCLDFRFNAGGWSDAAAVQHLDAVVRRMRARMSSTSFPRASAEEHVARMLKSVWKPATTISAAGATERAERRPRERVVLALVDDDLARARLENELPARRIGRVRVAGRRRCCARAR